MTTMVEDIAVALEGQFVWLRRPSTVVGPAIGNLYLSDLPDAPDDAVALYQYPGEPPARTLGNSTAYEKPRLQVLIRNNSSNLANQQAYEITNFLKYINSETVNGVYYLQVFPVSSPAELGPDSKNRQRWAVNFSVWKEWPS